MATSSNRPVIFNSDEHSAAAIVCADGGAGLGHAFYKRTCKKGREIERERKREKETERGTEKKNWVLSLPCQGRPDSFSRLGCSARGEPHRVN